MAKKRFELVDAIPDDVLEYTEYRPRGRPSMSRDVTWPAFATGSITLVLALGTIIAVAMFLNEYGIQFSNASWIGAAAASTAFACIPAGYVFWYQLQNYRDNQVVERHFKRAEPTPEHIERLVEKDPDNDYLYKVGSIKWREGALDKLAKERLFTKDGAWKGEDKVVRRVMAGLIVNETERFPNVLEEFAHVGWIDNVENKLWTQRGKDAMRLRWDKLNSPHPK